jgi:hypothetical protein
VKKVVVRLESSVWWRISRRESSSRVNVLPPNSKNSPKVGSGRGWRQGHVVLQVVVVCKVSGSAADERK